MPHFPSRPIDQPRVVLLAMIAAIGLGVAPYLSAEAVVMRPGDIVFAVFDGYGGPCLDGCGAVVKIDPVTGEHTPISVGGLFRDPTGVALDPTTGQLVVTDRDRPLELVGVDPETGDQYALPTLPAGACTGGCGMEIDRNGVLYLGGTRGDLHAWRLEDARRIPGVTGSVFALEREGTVVGWFSAALWRNSLWRPYEEQFVTDRGYLERPQAMTVDASGMLIVATSFTALVEVDPMTGEQHVLKSGLMPPMLDEGIAAEASGDILFSSGDPTSLHRFHRDSGEVTFLSQITTQQNFVAKRPGNFFVYPTTPCNDGLDNDGDGLIDVEADPGCEHRVASREDPPCQDGLDNDADGEVDFDGGASANDGVALAEAEAICGFPWTRHERRACGLGGEAASIVALVRFLRRRAVGC